MTKFTVKDVKQFEDIFDLKSKKYTKAKKHMPINTTKEELKELKTVI